MKKSTLILTSLAMLGLSIHAFAGETQTGMTTAQDAAQAVAGEQQAETNASSEANATQSE